MLKNGVESCEISGRKLFTKSALENLELYARHLYSGAGGFSKSKSSPIPVPKAVIIVLISSLDKALSNLAFSTFNILPLSGSIA